MLTATVKGLRATVDRLAANGSAAETASAVEFLLEGLHLSRRLNRDRVGGGYAYRRASREADEPGVPPRPPAERVKLDEIPALG